MSFPVLLLLFVSLNLGLGHSSVVKHLSSMNKTLVQGPGPVGKSHDSQVIHIGGGDLFLKLYECLACIYVCVTCAWYCSVGGVEAMEAPAPLPESSCSYYRTIPQIRGLFMLLIDQF